MSGRWAVAAAALLTLLVHWPVLQGELVYDDHRFVERNRAIEEVGSPLRFFTDPDTVASPDSRTRDIYRPVRTLSYAVVYALAGKTPQEYELAGENAARPVHALSVLLHTAVTALLVGLLLAAGLRPWTALAAALVYALHPVTVEATAWISSLGDLWCGLFTVGSVLAHARGRTLLAVLLLVPALFSKEHAVIAPLLWVLWDLTIRRETLRRTLVAGLLPGLALVGAFLFLRDQLGVGTAQTEFWGGSRGTAALTMLSGLGYYAAGILFPTGSTFDTRVEVQTTVEAPVLIGAAVLLVLLWGAFRGPRRVRLACGWFLVGLVPVSNVLVPLKIPTADRFLYIPLMGVAFAVGELARTPGVQRYAKRFGWAVPAILALLTLDRIGDWRSEETLNEARKRADPKSLTALWQEAAIAGKRFQESALRGGFREDLLIQAIDKYELYLSPRNTLPLERVRAHVELADVLFLAGTHYQRTDRPNFYIKMYGEALKHYDAANQLHRRGVGVEGREDEVRHTAERILRLAVLLALPENPELERVVQRGIQAGQFLEARFPDADAARKARWKYQGAQLLLAHGIRWRAGEGEKRSFARRELLQAQRAFREIERETDASTAFQRAQCLYYLALFDGLAQADLEALERAFGLFLRAAEEARPQRLQSLFHAARTACVIGRASKDETWIRRGREILESIPTVARTGGLRIPGRLEQQIRGLEASCR